MSPETEARNVEDPTWRTMKWLVAAVVLGAVLVPVLGGPLLPTQDGPSHVYNAFIDHRVAEGDTLWSRHFELGAALAPNRTSHALLTTLGPLVGWSVAERITAALAAGLTFVGLLVWQRRGTGRLELALLPVAAWMSSSWFFWKGFYDFSLSIGVFAILTLLLQRGFPDRPAGAAREDGGRDRTDGAGGEERGRERRAGPGGGGGPNGDGGPGGDGTGRALRRHLPVQLAVAVLFLTHLFTFAVGLGLLGFHLLRRAWRDDGPWTDLLAVLPGVVALVAAVSGGTLGGGELDWWPLELIVEHFVLASWSVSFDGLDGAAGLLMTAGLLAAPIVRIVRSEEADTGLTGFELFAYLSVVLSLAAPSHVGTGLYAPERMRILGLVLLLPSAGRAMGVGRATNLVGWGAGAAVAALFALHAHQALEASRKLSGDLSRMRSAFRQSGIGPGTWIQAAPWNPMEGTHRIGGLVHLHKRVAREMELVDLDNYEARSPVFRVNWRSEPRRLDIVAVVFAGRPGWLLEVHDGTYYPEEPVYVLHERMAPLISQTRTVQFGTRVGEAGEWVVGTVRLSPTPPESREGEGAGSGGAGSGGER